MICSNLYRMFSSLPLSQSLHHSSFIPIRNLLPSERSVSYWMLLLVHSTVVFSHRFLAYSNIELRFLFRGAFTLYTIHSSVHSTVERCRVKFYSGYDFYDSFGCTSCLSPVHCNIPNLERELIKYLYGGEWTSGFYSFKIFFF